MGGCRQTFLDEEEFGRGYVDTIRVQIYVDAEPHNMSALVMNWAIDCIAKDAMRASTGILPSQKYFPWKCIPSRGQSVGGTGNCR